MTPKERAAMQQALGALVRAEALYGQPNADIQTAIREALAEQVDMNLNCKSVQKRLATSWGYVKPSAVRAGYFAYDAEHNIWEEVSSADAPGATALYLVGHIPETISTAAIKLPVDVTIGYGTIKAGCSLQTLLTRIEIINQTWQPKIASEVCNWSQPTYSDAECNAWQSDCGEYWAITEGTPTENNMKFCHGCGKPIKEQPFQDTEDSE